MTTRSRGYSLAFHVWQSGREAGVRITQLGVQVDDVRIGLAGFALYTIDTLFVV